jgi:hypothetical protein
MPGTKGGLWSYRRLVDSAQMNSAFGHDLSMFNWPGNDYRGDLRHRLSRG